MPLTKSFFLQLSWRIISWRVFVPPNHPFKVSKSLTPAPRLVKLELIKSLSNWRYYWLLW
jgi:hypothetical protein